MQPLHPALWPACPSRKRQLGLRLEGLEGLVGVERLAQRQQPRDSDTESEEDEAPEEDEEEEVAPMRVTRARAGATAVLA